MSRPFNRQYLEFAYSLVLIVLIPAAIIAGTLWLTSQVQAGYDQELRRKANLANEVFGVSVANILAANDRARSVTLIQQLIDQTRTLAPDIDHLSVSLPATTGSGFTTVASSTTTQVNQPDASLQTQLAWSKGQAIASLVAVGESRSRDWLVATPVIAGSGATVAVATMRVSLREADQLMNTLLWRAFAGLAGLVIIIVLLLLNHFRLVQYAELFRQQRELSRMKDDFISIATHELKAPMSVIKGYISMALEEQLVPAARDMLQTAFDQTDRLGRLVTDLLDVSRIEQGRTQYHLQPVHIAGIIQPLMATTFKEKAAGKGLALAYTPPADLPAVMADPDRTAEVFTNLIDNAIKYSKTGSVTVQHVVMPASLITTVADTGIGMTAAEVEQLFQRFYRARNTDTQDIPGTGLGLWIIRQYIEAMGGKITVESRPHQGTTFTVTLPLVQLKR